MTAAQKNDERSQGDPKAHSSADELDGVGPPDSREAGLADDTEQTHESEHQSNPEWNELATIVHIRLPARPRPMR